jgi:hypothetical protein
MENNNQINYVFCPENWVESEMIQRGWKTLRLKLPLHQGDILAVKNSIRVKISVKSRKILSKHKEELHVYIGFHFHELGTGDFIILIFENNNLLFPKKTKTKLDEKFGKRIRWKK